MRILAINQFYHPDHAATSQLLTQLCEDLVAAGDEVTVIASRGAYLGGGGLPARETVSGVEVVRAWATSLGKGSITRRLGDYGSFWVSAVASAVAQRRPDVIVALTTPPMIAAGAAAVAAARGVPLVAWVQDVYPEVAVAFGVFPAQSPIARGFGLLARATHARSRFSVALSDGMAARLETQGQRRERIRVIQNWSDGEALRPLPQAARAFRAEHGLEGRFVAMYSGNIGVGHDVETLVAAARRLDGSRPDVRFVFVGEGGRREEAERLARGLGNVRFLPHQPYESLAASLSAADVHLASLRTGLEGLLVPSKLYGVLAVGRPLFYVGPPACELARVIDRHDVGWAGRPGDASGLAEAIVRAANDPARVAAQGARARAVFLDCYDRPVATRRWRDVLAEAVSVP